ncbi:unnamed protein product, partial [Pylaiella littoralis]
RALRRKRTSESRDLKVLEDVLLVRATKRIPNPVLLSFKMLAYYARARAVDALRDANDMEARLGVLSSWDADCNVRGILGIIGTRAKMKFSDTFSKKEFFRDLCNCVATLNDKEYSNGHVVCLRAMSGEPGLALADTERIPICRHGVNLERSVQLAFPVVDEMFERRAAARKLEAAKGAIATKKKTV